MSLSCVSGVYTFIVDAVCLFEVCIEPKFKDAATQWEDLTKTDHRYKVGPREQINTDWGSDCG